MLSKERIKKLLNSLCLNYNTTAYYAGIQLNPNNYDTPSHEEIELEKDYRQTYLKFIHKNDSESGIDISINQKTKEENLFTYGDIPPSDLLNILNIYENTSEIEKKPYLNLTLFQHEDFNSLLNIIAEKQKIPPIIKEISIISGHNNIKKITEKIENFSKLEHLYIFGTNIEHLTPQIENLNELKTFQVITNQLINIPQSMKRLKKLEFLNLKDNKISKVPNYIGELSQLHTINLSWNQISKLPESIGNLKKLYKLDLSHNPITESDLPKSLKNLIERDEFELIEKTKESLFIIKRKKNGKRHYKELRLEIF